jgi:hypothetical protein
MDLHLPMEITNHICDYTNDLKNDTFLLQFHKNGKIYFKLNKQSNTCNTIQKNIMGKLQHPLINELLKLQQMEIYTQEKVYKEYSKHIVFMYKVYFQLNPYDTNYR